jgi:hypothetical protein
VVVIRRGKLQQLREGCCSGLMHGGTDRRFDGFRVEAADFAAPGEHSLQQLFYFVRDFLVDRCGRFFSSGDTESSTGRARQIFSLISNNSWLSCRKRWKASTSRWALRSSAAEEKLSLTVFPSTLRVKRKFGPWPG